ncbi:MAG: GTPase HflX [Candidatus Nephrothrix sp. EaCA]|nr:MAG: GTPase HflX [Candidatus Nephrothrix sp. EaCA]
MKGILISVQTQAVSSAEVEEYLKELALLAETAGIEAAGSFTQRLEHPDGRTCVGKGKLEEIKTFAANHSVDCLLFDDDLTASQLKNLEKELNKEERKIRIYDRSLLILEIFEMRAQTAQAKTQVELAMNEYLLPRLTRLWTHLERQRGGTGARGGSGEKEIETDRRIIRHRIALLKEELRTIKKQQDTQRKGRSKMVRVALVGYTNAGKSTIMNLMVKAETVKAENKLFATVDSTVRKVVARGIPFLLSDTVGFIRKLPHHLIESFKSTLDEVREADLLLHVTEVSHPFHDHHLEVVKQTLHELGATDKPTVLVLNKADQLSDEIDKEALVKSYKQNGFTDVILMSALAKEDKDRLKKTIFHWIEWLHHSKYPNIKYPEAADINYEL